MHGAKQGAQNSAGENENACTHGGARALTEKYAPGTSELPHMHEDVGGLMLLPESSRSGEKAF
jgi:hypothetical protein